jgi:hypothetical protein
MVLIVIFFITLPFAPSYRLSFSKMKGEITTGISENLRTQCLLSLQLTQHVNLLDIKMAESAKRIKILRQLGHLSNRPRAFRPLLAKGLALSGN